MIEELLKSKYEFQGDGNLDSIKCLDCKERISVEEVYEARDGNYYCEICGKEIDKAYQKLKEGLSNIIKK